MWNLTAREVHDHTAVAKRGQGQEHILGDSNRVRETL